MTLTRPILALMIATTLAACAQTETQRHGYQTAELVARADEICFSTPSPDPYAAERANIARIRHGYNVAVLQGDRTAMRDALDNLNVAVKAWGVK